MSQCSIHARVTLLHVNRVEVFDVFRAMSSDMDAQDKPFSFDIVKGFMEKITELGMSSGANMVESIMLTLSLLGASFFCTVLFSAAKTQEGAVVAQGRIPQSGRRPCEASRNKWYHCQFAGRQ